MVFDTHLNPHGGVPPCNSLNELTLYLTGSGFADGDQQLMFLWGQFLATGELATFLAPSSPLRHVTLRFQRFGPHTKTTERMLQALLSPNNWFRCIGWMERLLSRFKGLKTIGVVKVGDSVVVSTDDSESLH